MTYESIRRDLKTGDILLFSGTGFVSWLIKRITFSKYSHVGMVYVIDRNVYCWESTSLTKGRDGVQISLLSNKLLSYKGKVWVRHLTTNRSIEFYNAIDNFRDAVKKRRYEQNIWELMGSALPWKNKANLTTIFCSELVAEALKRACVIARGKPSNEYTPADFASEDINKELDNSALGDEILLESEEKCFG